jgi:hypothetical protein
MARTIRATIRGMSVRANPAFALGAVEVPVGVLAYAVMFAPVQIHTYAHVMAGVLWTGIDLFMALVLGPVLGGLAVEERASVFERFTPKMTFLMPSLALVTIVGGITLAGRLGYFPHADPWLALFTAATLVPALSLIGWQFDAFRDRRWLAAFGLAAVISAASLTATEPDFAWTRPVIVVSLAIVTVISVIGFGVLLPGEVRIYRKMVSDDPDPDVISRVGLRNAKLSGVQGAFQLAVVGAMVYLRWGGF